ncbi:MAG: hypothetical protein V1691_03705 [Chloroflexota bacterium]
MEIKDRVEALESEFKLIKGELKQTLASVRDYLIDLRLPPPDNAAMAGIIEEESPLVKGEVTMTTGAGGLPPRAEALSPPAREPENLSKPKQVNSGLPEPEPPEQVSAEPELSQPTPFEPEPYEEEWMPEEKLTEEELPRVSEARNQRMPERPAAQEIIRQETNLSTPPVNLLANLIRWVSNAKKTIGIEQLPIFLEVYGISGHLSPELKDVILHLAEITEPLAADNNAADIWSQLTLELHGIFTGGDAPLHPMKPFWGNVDSEPEPEGAAAEETSPAERPFKLKLVLPGGDGEDKEFSISLNPECIPEAEQKSPAKKPSPRKRPEN